MVVRMNAWSLICGCLHNVSFCVGVHWKATSFFCYSWAFRMDIGIVAAISLVAMGLLRSY
jgi:hypothetical protein